MGFFIFLVCFIILGITIFGGYFLDWNWTGFSISQPTPEGVSNKKLLWDWLDLLFVPFAVVIGAWYLQRSQRNTEKLIEEEHEQRATFENYLEWMTSVILDGKILDASNSAIVSELARIRTLTALRSLDGGRKADVLQFLRDAGLIEKDNSILSLNSADFRYALLDSAILSDVKVHAANFQGASFKDANLARSDFTGCDFSHANFEDAEVIAVNFFQASLKEAKISQNQVESSCTHQTRF